MKDQPRYVKKGEAIKASGYNTLIDSVRRLDPTVIPVTNIKNSRSRAFDVIDTKYEDNAWSVRLKAGFIQDGSTNFYVFYEDGNGDHWPLGGSGYPDTFTSGEILDFNYPWILVEEGKTLCIDLNTHKLKWVDLTDPDGGCVPIGKFTITADKLSCLNVSPANIIKDSNHPFKVNIIQTLDPLNPETINLSVTPGYVLGINTNGGADAIDKRMPTDADGAYLNDSPAPIFTGEVYQVVYVNVKIDSLGVMSEDPKVMVMASGEESVHYQPEPVAAAGDMYYPLGEIKEREYSNSEVGNFKIYYIEQYTNGDITVIADRPILVNLGGEREVYKTLNVESSEYEFRTLKQLTGTGGIEIIVPEGETEQDTIDFRYIKQKDSQPQVEVNLVGDAIEVKGNGVDISLGNVTRFSVSVLDGLVTSFLKEGPDGKNLNLAIEQLSYNNAGEIYGSPFVMATLYFRDGLYVGTIDPEDDPDPLMTLTVSWLVNAA